MLYANNKSADERLDYNSLGSLFVCLILYVTFNNFLVMSGRVFCMDQYYAWSNYIVSAGRRSHFFIKDKMRLLPIALL